MSNAISLKAFLIAKLSSDINTTSVLADFFLGEVGKGGCWADNKAWSTQIFEQIAIKPTNIFFCVSQIVHTSLQLLLLSRLLEGGFCWSVDISWKRKHCYVWTNYQMKLPGVWQRKFYFTCSALWAELDSTSRWLLEAASLEVGPGARWELGAVDFTWQFNSYKKNRVTLLVTLEISNAICAN